jgi:hypothetical protein
MKPLKHLVLGLLGLVAWTQIGISGEMLQVPRDQFTTGHFAYPALFLASVVYLHWLFRVFLMPLSHLGRHRQEALRHEAVADYAKGFLAGTVGLGYVLLALYIVGYLAGLRGHPATPNLVWPGVFFIALGTLAQVRALVRRLSGDLGRGIEPPAPPNVGPAIPVDQAGVQGGPPSVS